MGKHGGSRDGAGRKGKFSDYGYDGECIPIRLPKEFKEELERCAIELIRKKNEKKEDTP